MGFLAAVGVLATLAGVGTVGVVSAPHNGGTLLIVGSGLGMVLIGGTVIGLWLRGVLDPGCTTERTTR